MTTRFRTITIVYDEEVQTYVADQRASEFQIRSGNDVGVVCFCVDESKAETIAGLLNNYTEAGGVV